MQALKESNGSSRQAILKYIVSNYKVGDANKAQVRVKIALRKMIGAKKLVAGGASGKKGAGCFKLATDTAAKPVKAKKKATVKKPKAKTAVKKLTVTIKKPVKKSKPIKAKNAEAVKKDVVAKKPAAKKAAPKKGRKGASKKK